jgi:hypothetical protein
LNTTTTGQPLVAGVPGTTASGVASASQLVERTAATTLRVDLTASPRKIIVFKSVQAHGPLIGVSSWTPLTAAEYPVLAGIWDNDEDDIFDTV